MMTMRLWTYDRIEEAAERVLSAREAGLSEDREFRLFCEANHLSDRVMKETVMREADKKQDIWQRLVGYMV